MGLRLTNLDERGSIAVSYFPLSKATRSNNSAGGLDLCSDTPVVAGPVERKRRKRCDESPIVVTACTAYICTDGRTDRRTDDVGVVARRAESGDERAALLPLTGKPKACEAVKNRFGFGSGCLLWSPRPFGFRHSGRAVFRSRGFLKEREPRRKGI